MLAKNNLFKKQIINQRKLKYYSLTMTKLKITFEVSWQVDVSLVYEYYKNIVEYI